MTEDSALAKLAAAYSTDKRESLQKKGKAFKNSNGDASYPIPDVEHLRAAIQAFGRSKPEDRDRLKSFIMKRARELGHPELIPDSWSGGSMAASAVDDLADKVELAAVNVRRYKRRNAAGRQVDVSEYVRHEKSGIGQSLRALFGSGKKAGVGTPGQFPEHQTRTGEADRLPAPRTTPRIGEADKLPAKSTPASEPDIRWGQKGSFFHHKGEAENPSGYLIKGKDRLGRVKSEEQFRKDAEKALKKSNADARRLRKNNESLRGEIEGGYSSAERELPISEGSKPLLGKWTGHDTGYFGPSAYQSDMGSVEAWDDGPGWRAFLKRPDGKNEVLGTFASPEKGARAVEKAAGSKNPPETSLDEAASGKPTNEEWKRRMGIALKRAAMSSDGDDSAIAALSAKTGALSTVHSPLGDPNGPGLFHTKGLQLPAYIQNIAKALMRDHGMTESHAIATAISRVKVWAAGGGGVSPEVQAAAAKAVAEWEAAKARAHATPNKR